MTEVMLTNILLILCGAILSLIGYGLKQLQIRLGRVEQKLDNQSIYDYRLEVLEKELKEK